ncbi:MAG: hypothetical protein ACOC53_05160, partial [Candidatus Saliniplasma sp.]
LINGGGGGSVGDTCPGEWSYDSWDECRLYHDYDTCADLCFGDYEEGRGPELPDGVKCVLGNLGVDMISNYGCYWLCGGGLKSCWYLGSPKFIIPCLAATCVCAAGDLAWAIADCL